MKFRVQAIALLTALLSLAGTLSASADPGDKTRFRDTLGGSFATNQCGTAEVTTIVRGGPYPNPTYGWAQVSTGPQSACRAQVRVSYIKENKTLAYTPWASVSGTGGNATAMFYGWRCSTSVKIRRNDGSWWYLHFDNPDPRIIWC